MEQLFIEPLKFEKISKTILKSDSGTWSKDILSEFYETFPYLLNYPVDLSFKKKDERRGYAIGTIQFQAVSVPVIVEDYLLHPFDIAYVNGVTVPFTADTVASLFANPTAYAQLNKYEHDDGHTPLFDRSRGLTEPEPHYKHSSADMLLDREYESILDKVSNFVSGKARDEILQKIARNETVATGFIINETQEALDKFAAVEPLAAKSYKNAISCSLPRDLFSVEILHNDKYLVKLGSSEVYDPVELLVSERQALQLQNSWRKVAEYHKPRSTSQIRRLAVQTKGADNYCTIKTAEGRIFLVDTDSAKYAPVSDRMVPLGDFDKLASVEVPNIGDDGFLKIGEVTYGPLSVTQVHRIDGDVVDFEASSGLDKKAYVYLSGIDCMLPHQDLPNTVYIPKTAEFVKVAGMLTLDSYGVDTRSHDVINNGNDTYTLRGPVFSKYAKKFDVAVNSVALKDAEWHASQCGYELAKYGSFKDTKVYEPRKLTGEFYVPLDIDELSANIKLAFTNDIEKARVLALDLTKEASVIPDKTTVDAVLALGVLSTDNVTEFVQQVPMLENVASYLARLLLSSRLGLRIVPEKAVKKAMESIATIIETLRAVAAIRKPVK